MSAAIRAPMNWGALVNIILLAASLRAAVVSFGPAAQRIGEDLDLSSTALGLLGSLPVIAFGLVAGFVDRPVRWFGFDRLSIFSLIALALGLVTRLLPDAWAMWLGTAVIGLGIGVLNVLAPAFVKRDFPTRTSAITGVYSSVIAGAAGISIALVTPLTNAFDGNWRIALTASLPVVLLAILLQSIRYFRDRSPGNATAEPVPVKVDKSATARVWRSPLAWAVTMFMGMQSLIFYAFMTWVPSMEMAAGFSEAQASLHLTIGQFLGIIATLITNTAMQRLQDQRIISVGLGFLGAVPILGMIFWPAFFPLWTPFMGLVMTAFLGVALALIGERAGSTVEAASLSGMAQSVGYILAAVGPVLLGGLFDLTGSWVPALWCLIAMFMVISAAGLVAGQNRTISNE
ncbi:MFS transporter [Gulosibacter chungangensis]|uniref:MFS transporter n=1 Tax=Gulosibacter chungangensis TaxID=979746 RepID=A0A7J5B9B7_9MICO|nr:MFS transporter [Gulosibacter chungangensis]KAB1642165.1 MFS transporter [Gulosibacter chungangensis]